MTAPKEKNGKYPEQELPESDIVSEPAAVYGSIYPLNLDETKRYTYADYLTWLDDKSRELINGFIRLMAPAASTRHARISSELVFKLTAFIKKRKGECLVFNAPFDVRLPNNKRETADDKIYTVVQPDICLICDLSKLDKNGCLGAPDLVIEVQSPGTTRYDATEKYDVYEKAGVPEYWLVYPIEETIVVYILQKNGKYDRGTVYEYEGKVPVKALEGLVIDLEELFGEFNNKPY
ncbi:MAG: Uma2 family endonuclease [Candidatus Azobacteroides sp.]|nr:Uma2 family endonuclease [Candidatus Azobacteroides sp.]